MVTPVNISATANHGHAPGKQAVVSEVQKMTGMLWDEMLTELDKTGMSDDTLGTGGSDFQSMFMWNIAQNDFGRYDAQLVDAALNQLGDGSGAPQADRTVLSDTLPPPALQALQSTADDAIGPISQGPVDPATMAAATDDSPVVGAFIDKAKTFAKAIWPQIQTAAQQLGVPPVAVLAQTALETGWGAAAPGNNLFGVKASDGQPSTTRSTTEVIDGVLTPQTASFRDYTSDADSISDYVHHIRSSFQGVVGQATVAGFANALQSSGYATDASYAAKIIGITQSPMMTQILQALGAGQQTVSVADPSSSNPSITNKAGEL
jgi:flagellar protein FlgJ